MKMDGAATATANALFAISCRPKRIRVLGIAYVVSPSSVHILLSLFRQIFECYQPSKIIICSVRVMQIFWANKDGWIDGNVRINLDYDICRSLYIVGNLESPLPHICYITYSHIGLETFLSKCFLSHLL